MNTKGIVPKDRAWKIISSETRFENRHVSLAIERVRTPTHTSGRSWTVVHRKAAVVIAGVTRSGKLVLIQQERIPIRNTIWEVPAGQVDDLVTNESALVATARRELSEETGYELAPDGELLSLGDYFCSPGFTDERGYFFLARPVERRPEGPAHEAAESIIDCREFSPAEIAHMISTNEIRDANTLSVCARLVARGLFDLRSYSINSQ